MNNYRSIIKSGLWNNNQGLVALLGLCPLLAVSNSTISALGLGLATTAVLLLSNTIIALFKNFIPKETRIPIFVIIIASIVTIVEMIMNAWWYDLYRKLGIFIPLIVTNCIILARAEAFASKPDNNVAQVALDGLFMGLGFLWVLLILGSIRELLGQGTLLSGANQLFGEMAKDWVIQVADFRLVIALLPAGAFISLGFLVAAMQKLKQINAKIIELQTTHE